MFRINFPETKMSNDTVQVERRGATAWIFLNRPEDLNALNPELVEGLQQTLKSLAKDREVRVIVITGNGRAFCAGADLKFFRGALEKGDTERITVFLEAFYNTLNLMEGMPKPVIAAVNGMALAGGLELVLACDLVVAAEDAQMGDAHANFGLIPGGGGSIRLPRKIGPTLAKELMFTGAFVPAKELLWKGLVNRAVPDGDLEGAVSELAETLAAKSPVSLGQMKALVNEGLNHEVDKGLRLELLAFEAHLKTSDLREGLAAFAEKRTPAYTGE